MVDALDLCLTPKEAFMLLGICTHFKEYGRREGIKGSATTGSYGRVVEARFM